MQIISPFDVYLNSTLVLQEYEVWRLITNFFYFGKLGVRLTSWLVSAHYCYDMSVGFGVFISLHYPLQSIMLSFIMIFTYLKSPVWLSSSWEYWEMFILQISTFCSICSFWQGTVSFLRRHRSEVVQQISFLCSFLEEQFSPPLWLGVAYLHLLPRLLISSSLATRSHLWWYVVPPVILLVDFPVHYNFCVSICTLSDSSNHVVSSQSTCCNWVIWSKQFVCCTCQSLYVYSLLYSVL